MNRAFQEVASTYCEDSSREHGKNQFGNILKDKNILLIVAAVVLICFCGGNNFARGGFCNPGGRCCPRGGGGNNSWIWILVVLLLCCGKGLGGTGLLSPGNINTNVIRVDAAEDYEDEYSDNCC